MSSAHIFPFQLTSAFLARLFQRVALKTDTPMRRANCIVGAKVADEITAKAQKRRCSGTARDTAAEAKTELPTSSLHQLMHQYYASLTQMAGTSGGTEICTQEPHRTERAVVQQLIRAIGDVEYSSCSNSPFFAGTRAPGTWHQKANYVRQVWNLMATPAYGRHLKIILLLLAELRFRILITDVQCAADLRRAPPPVFRMRGDTPAAREADLAALRRALSLIDGKRFRDAAQLQMRCTNLGRGKNSAFAKQVSLAFDDARRAVLAVANDRRTLHEAGDVSAFLAKWVEAGHDVAAAAQLLESPAFWRAHGDGLCARLDAVLTAHGAMAAGTDFVGLCRKLRGYVVPAFQPSRHPASSRQASKKSPDVLLGILLGECGVAAAEAAVEKFCAVAERLHETVPELWAINWLLHRYGVSAAAALARDVDVSDGGFKQVCGEEFEEHFVQQESAQVAAQVLVPHCCSVTGCDATTATAWVTGCLLCRPTSPSEAATASPAWPGVAPATSPPEYRLVRGLQYRWNEAGLVKLGNTSGELDGVVYDARTREVLFVLEAKRNVADLGRAARQKARLYGALDLTWKTLAAPPEPLADAVQPAAEPTGAKRDRFSKQPPHASVPTGPVEMQFLPAPAGPRPRVADAAVEGTEGLDGEVHDAEAAARPVDAAAEEAPAAFAAATRPARTVWFTQDDFAAHFLAPTPAAVSHVDPAAEPVPQALSHATLRREQRWVYLTSLYLKETDEIGCSMAAPGGGAQLVEGLLVEVACDTITEAYRLYAHGSGVPPPVAPALRSLLYDMSSCSAYGAGAGPVPVLDFPLDVPCTRDLCTAAGLAEPATAPEAYAFALSLFRHDARLEDGTSALAAVRLHSDFLRGLPVRDDGLMHSVKCALGQVARRYKGAPTFLDVLQSLVQEQCVRNLVIVMDSNSTKEAAAK